MTEYRNQRTWMYAAVAMITVRLRAFHLLGSLPLVISTIPLQPLAYALMALLIGIHVDYLLMRHASILGKSFDLCPTHRNI